MRPRSRRDRAAIGCARIGRCDESLRTMCLGGMNRQSNIVISARRDIAGMIAEVAGRADQTNDACVSLHSSLGDEPKLCVITSAPPHRDPAEIRAGRRGEGPLARGMGPGVTG